MAVRILAEIDCIRKLAARGRWHFWACVAVQNQLQSLRCVKIASWAEKVRHEWLFVSAKARKCPCACVERIKEFRGPSACEWGGLEMHECACVCGCCLLVWFPFAFLFYTGPLHVVSVHASGRGFPVCLGWTFMWVCNLPRQVCLPTSRNSCTDCSPKAFSRGILCTQV